MHSPSEENYLKALFALEYDGARPVNTNLLAARLKTKASSVTDMARKLQQKKLVHYRKYRGMRLTAGGRKVALDVLRKHRLWETFLVQKLNYRWDEVHEIAEQLEHVRHKDLIDRLDAFLGFPATDPHGDPIPDRRGVLRMPDSCPITVCRPGDRIRIVGLRDSSDELLRFLDRKTLRIGDTLTIRAIDDYDRSVRLTGEDKDITLSALAAGKILVEKL